MARLLVIDDDPATCDLMVEVLGQEGHAVRAADSPDTALGLLGEERFDLVLTDLFGPSYLSLPLDTLRQIKTAAGDTPVLVVTAREAAADLNPAEAGVTEVIIKPFELDALVERVQALLG